MKIFLFLGSRRGYAVLSKLIEKQAAICGILCLIEDAHEEPYHPKITHLAKEKSIPIFYTNEVKPAEYAPILNKINPDIAFAIGWRYLITKETYTVPVKGTLVLHDSLLPKYRGFAPMNWAIINGETETGVTLFCMSEGVDNGPIIAQLTTPIERTDTAKTLDEKIIKLYEQIMVENLPALASGTAKSLEQNESLATYTCKRTPADGEIKWYNSALEIHNLIRGLTRPFPGAYTTLNGRKIYIWEAEFLDKKNYVGCIPGRVLGKHNGKIEVLTGNGVLYITRLQYADEEEKSAADVCISVKDTFGK